MKSILLLTKIVVMKTKITLFARSVALVAWFITAMTSWGQNVPEYMYYKFDAAGNQQNFASAPVGTNPAVLAGIPVSGSGQFGTALVGNGLTSTSNRLSTGWATSLPNTGWTISFWLNNFPATSSTTFYYFGDNTAASFRCFTGGVAGNGNLLLRATGFTDVPINGISPGPIVIHLVYTGSEVKVFKNGVFSNSVTQNAVAFTGTGPFLVAGYSSSNSINSGTLMDEFRLYNRALSDAEVGQTWNQQLPLATGPVVVTTAASSIGSTTATLNGTVNANNSATTVTFEYGLTAAYGTTIAGVPATVTGNAVTPVTGAISGLQPNTLYHYRIKGVNTGGTANGNDMTFTTNFAPPDVVTTNATAINLNGATLNGTVNANSDASSVIFEYGTTLAYGSTIVAVPPSVTGNSVTPVNAILSGLPPNTLYHYRVVATNSGGTSNGNDMTFTTGGPPSVVTNPATNITATSAQLNGTVTANNVLTTVTFEWGLTTSYGNVANATPSTVSGATATPVLANIGGLTTNSTYHFRCVGVNAGGTTYGADQFFMAGCPPVGPAGPISGPAAVCANSVGIVYGIAPITNATSYTWTLPAGAVITAGAGTTTITVTFGATAGDVSVLGTGPCGNGTPSTLAITINPLPVPVIAGPATSCAGSLSNIYTTQGGMSGYTWTASAGGTITAGAGTSTITVKWNTAGAQSISVTYTNAGGCQAAAPVIYPVTVNVSPAPTITGAINLCVNSGYVTYATETGFTNYTWAVSSGGSVFTGAGTNQVMVSWNLPGSQYITVNYTNTVGCQAGTPTQLNVTVNPAPGSAGAITGNAAVCAGALGVSYSTVVIPNAATYVWSLPPGASIATGDGTANITVDFASNAVSGGITVYGNNLCGNGSPSASFAVTVNPLPANAGAITGNAQACLGSTGNVYTVPAIANATGYTWTLPAGATITAGQGTNAITVSFGASATSGNITVLGTNTCGNGTISPALPVSVNPVPPKPTILANGPVMTSSALSGNQWYFSVTPEGTGNPIAGAIWPYYLATQSGYYWIVVTESGCTSLPSDRVQVIMTGLNEIAGLNVNLFPVPNDGRFSLTISGTADDLIGVSVINSLGVKIYERNDIRCTGNIEQIIDLRPVPAGIYHVMIGNKNGVLMRKIVIGR
jgi:hypothetical protein